MMPPSIKTNSRTGPGFPEPAWRRWLIILCGAVLFASCQSPRTAFTGQSQWGTFSQAKPERKAIFPKAEPADEKFAANEASLLAYADQHTPTAASFEFNTRNKPILAGAKPLAGGTKLQHGRPAKAKQVYDELKPALKTEKLATKSGKAKTAEDDQKVPVIALAGFVLSMLALASVFLTFFWWPMVFVGALLGVLGLIFSIAAIVKLVKNPERFKGRGWAVTGLVIIILYFSILSLLLDAYFSQGIE